MIVRNRYKNSFTTILNEIPHNDMKSFLETHEIINLISSVKEIAGIIQIAIIKARDYHANSGRPYSFKDESEYLCRIFETQFKNIIKFDDLVGLLETLSAVSGKAPLLEFAIKMKHLISNGDQLSTILQIFKSKSNSVPLIKEVENYWKAEHPKKCRLEFMTGSVDENAHSHMFFKALGEDANVIAARIFEMADMALDSKLKI